MITSAQTTVLVQAKSPTAATEAASKIADNFDSTQWICVMPDRSLVVTAGSYVLLTVGTQNVTQAMVDAFKVLSKDTAGDPVVFFTN